ncbi:sigma-70 family RNA polymerase sigma factor [Candidatus Poribacteria bacterium]|nr:sigma-70 family RNA polymerase sigma factor [Candidatus Poribacteria bacterium]
MDSGQWTVYRLLSTPFVSGLLMQVNSRFRRDWSVNQQEEEQMQPLDVDLVKRTKNGDTVAFEKLFLAYRWRVYNLAYRMIGNDADAADFTQETFIRVYEAIASLRNEAAFSTWLFRIVINLCKNHRKAAKLECDSFDELTDENGEIEWARRELRPPTSFGVATLAESPESTLEKKERHQQIQAALNTLTDEHRAVVVWHHLEGVSLVEIANRLNCRVGTVKSRLARAREELKRRLRPYIES